MGRFRCLLGEEDREQLLKATIECDINIKAIKPAEFERVILDPTVQPKAAGGLEDS
jgi:IS5 family transposase